MTDRSGGAGGFISLPKGGGALSGLGEKFAPDLHTGTGNFTVPLALPPGRNGFQPTLSLGYSTGHGNGPIGLGWALSVPGVCLKTSQGLPLYENQDTFILSGAEDLVPVVQPVTGEIRYRPRTEGLFARIRHLDVGAATDHWQVDSKDGLVSLYGIPAVPGDETARVRDPADTSRVFAWKLTQTTDTFGNRIEYAYDRDGGSDSKRRWDQLYLKRIRYVDYGPRNSTQFLVTVSFVYDEERPDPFSDYRAGFEIRTTRRCRRIEVAIDTGAGATPIRMYHFQYADDTAASSSGLSNGVSLLTGIQLEGLDGEKSEKLPPLTFGYTAFESQGRKFIAVEGELPATSLANPDIELVDLFGHGLPDILELSGTPRYWRNRGHGKFELPREMSEAPSSYRLSDRGVQLVDADGDGHTDLLVTTPEFSGYFPLRYGGLWQKTCAKLYRHLPSIDLEDPEVRLVDLDGDGVTDVIRSSTRLECFFNHRDPKLAWTETPRWVERGPLEDFPNVNFSDSRGRWADMSGDGLQDILLVHSGSIVYWPNLGRGRWGKRVEMRWRQRLPWGYDPRRVLLGDVDGDGLADMVYVEDGRVTLWINQSGNAWSDPVTIEGTPPVSDLDSIRLTDLLGGGICGVLWSADATGTSRPRMFFLDFTGGVKPYLLHEMDNHLGATTRVDYSPSTRFYLEDQTRRETRWKTPLPFPVHVVARVEIIDWLSQGKLTASYRYHHGYWDGEEREFRGFGMVETFDSDIRLHGAEAIFESMAGEHFSPPTLTRTWYHQGPVGDEFDGWRELDLSPEYWSGDPSALTRPAEVTELLRSLEPRHRRDALRALRGSVLRTELYALDGTSREARPYTVTELVYGLRQESSPQEDEKQDRVRVFFPYAAGQRVTQWERGDDPLTSASFTDDHDSFGQPQRQLAVAVPRGRNPREADFSADPYLATRTLTGYISPRDDVQRYLADRVAWVRSDEVVNDGSASLLEFVSTIQSEQPPSTRIIGLARSYYDGHEFVGLDRGQVGDFGVLVRSENLVLTQEILRQAYRSGAVETAPAEEPPYLAESPVVSWGAEYASVFKAQVPADAGYIRYPAGASLAEVGGLFALGERKAYDWQLSPGSTNRGLTLRTQNALGRVTSIEYDKYDLLPMTVTDPINLRTAAQYDYRVGQPVRVTDANDNVTEFVFNPLGLLQETWVKGKLTKAEGDRIRGSVFLTYDLLAFERSRQPVSVHTERWELHDTDLAGAPEMDRSITTVELSDGFGRLLQSRTQSEDVRFGDPLFGGGEAVLPTDQATGSGGHVKGVPQADPGEPNVVVSGWQRYDNKGRVVEKFEPFLATGWAYLPPAVDQHGKKVTMFYDPRGQVIRTVNPDHSEQRVIYGVPRNLAQIDQLDNIVPTPWEAYTYDANDNAGRTHGAAAQNYARHWDTPSSIEIDALGRTIRAVQRNGVSPAEWYETASTYDIQGNVLTITDPLGRHAFSYTYDLAHHALRTESIDAGVRRTVLDVLGNPVEQRDGKGAIVLHSYDPLNRPRELWARDYQLEAVTLRQVFEYGDGSTDHQPPGDRDANRDLNRLGKLARTFDEAGRLELGRYDFKGNLLEKARRVIADSEILSTFPLAAANNGLVPAYRVDWDPGASATLDDRAAQILGPAVYRTTTSYDARNRVRQITYPAPTGGSGKVLVPGYNRAGALERVEMDGQLFVERIAYNARGQRVLIAYGNGAMTRYAYDPDTFRLVRLHTRIYSTAGADTYRPSGPVLQDLAYEYDLAGNILRISDHTPASGIPNTVLGTTALDRAFTYDPIYRLLSASGREADAPPTPPIWDPGPWPSDPTKVRGYVQSYQYDPAGNLINLQHVPSEPDASGTAFTRVFTPVGPAAAEPGSNRLATMTVGGTTYTYTYDVNGNLTGETTSRHFEWDFADRMRVFRNQTSHSAPTEHAHYLYDGSGERVLKFVRHNLAAYDVTVYVNGLFEHFRWDVGASQPKENLRHHVIDNGGRIAVWRTGASDDQQPDVLYHLGDHLGSSSVVLGGARAMESTFVNREEYYPYGETSFGSFARKRFRLAGKERDDESGLMYCVARYYAAHACRWMSVDPLAPSAGLNGFVYCRDSPVCFIDRTGQAESASTAPSASGTDPTPATVESAEQTRSGLAQEPAESIRRPRPSWQVNYEGNETLTSEEPTPALREGTRDPVADLKAVRPFLLLLAGAAIALVGFSKHGPSGEELVRLPSAETGVETSLPGVAGEEMREPPFWSSAPFTEPVEADVTPVTDERGEPMELGRPNAVRRSEHAPWGWYLDPFTSLPIYGQRTVMATDHIYPDSLIRKLAGFENLTPAQQTAVLNYEKNFQPLPQWLNSSKGPTPYPFWNEAPRTPGDPSSIERFDPSYLRSMTGLSNQIRRDLRGMINGFLQASFGP